MTGPALRSSSAACRSGANSQHADPCMIQALRVLWCTLTHRTLLLCQIPMQTKIACQVLAALCPT